MTETFTCGDHGALVSYLYDECTPGERRAIGAHAAICGACAEELASLGATREQLAAWTPPEAQLGFRIVAETPPSNVLRPSGWWQKPMPAWAQAAAAALIFATGVTLGALRGTTAAPGPEASAARPAGATVAAGGAAVTRTDLAALEQRLRAEMSQARTVSQRAAASPDDARVLERVRAMIDESEQRQRRELAFRTTEVMRDFDAQRNDDLVKIERTLGQFDGTTGVEMAQQRQMLNYLMRVSQRGQ
jgi:anti-sigma factor ChrR (cupin superfamily)